MTQGIVATIQPNKIYLLGSLAFGEAHENSNLDLLIRKTSFYASHRCWAKLNRTRKTFSAYRAEKAVLVYSSAELAKWQSSLNQIIGCCLRKGK